MKKRLFSKSLGLVAASLFALLVVFPGISMANTYTIDTDFGSLATVNYGTVTVIDTGANLDFSISLNTATLGANADMRDFWFNLNPAITNVNIEVSSPSSTLTFPIVSPSDLPSDKNIFDGLVFLGNGTPYYNNVSFTLSADQALSISDILLKSDGKNGGYYFGVHVQSTDRSLVGDDSVKAGTSSVPIPGAAWLLGSGILGLAGLRRKMKKN